MERGTIFAENTIAEVITRPVVNIDEEIDLEWQDFSLTVRRRRSG